MSLLICNFVIVFSLRLYISNFPAMIYLLESQQGNTIRCETCSELTIKTPKRRQWRRSSVFNVNFEHISQIFLAFFLFMTLAGRSSNPKSFLPVLSKVFAQYFEINHFFGEFWSNGFSGPYQISRMELFCESR